MPILQTGLVETGEHRTAYLQAGPAGGPLLIFVHGWPELGLIWRHQMEHFARQGWRCVAPDMRGYGGSSIPAAPRAYALPELVRDLLELHDELGGEPAVWGSFPRACGSRPISLVASGPASGWGGSGQRPCVPCVAVGRAA